MKRILLAGLVFAGLAATAHAGTYVQVQGGVGGMDTKKYSAQSTPTTNDPYSKVSLRDSRAYRVALGYLRGNGTYSLGYEIGYGRNPKNTYTDAFNGVSETYRGTYYDLLSVTKYNFSGMGHGFYLVGKVGLARLSQKFTGAVTGSSSVSKTASAIKPEVIVGGGYDLTRKFSLDVTYQHIFGDKADPNGSLNSATEVSQVSALMAGITFSFS